MVHPFELVAHPVRRRILEVLAVGELGAVWSSVGADEPRSRSYRLNAEFLASLDLAVGSLFELWEQRYGTAEGRPPQPPLRADRVHRFGDAERRRRNAALAEWRADAGGDLDVD